MRAARCILAAVLIASACALAPGAAEAWGRNGAPGPNLAPPLAAGAPAIAARQAWGAGSRLIAEAARYLGSGKFTEPPGAWCADAVSFWLEAIGKPPLPNRMAASALSYGPLTGDPRPGDLVVMRGHVGVFDGYALDGRLIMISGNWGHRVALSAIARSRAIAFVSVDGPAERAATAAAGARFAHHRNGRRVHWRLARR